MRINTLVCIYSKSPREVQVMSMLGITPDLTTYSSTTRHLIEKYHKVADHIFEGWQVIKDSQGEVVDAIPEWHIKFKDGSEATVEPKGKPDSPTVGVYDPKGASTKDTQNIINKYIGSIRSDGVEIEYLIVTNNYEEKVAILPRRRFYFKSVDDIVEGLKRMPANTGGK